jgi:hypothetical protein
MDVTNKSASAVATTEAIKTRRRYKQPLLSIYGTVKNLTEGRNGSVLESTNCDRKEEQNPLVCN